MRRKRRRRRRRRRRKRLRLGRGEVGAPFLSAEGWLACS
jgi:hypothetical protein